MNKIKHLLVDETWRLQNILSAKDRTIQKSNKDTGNLSDAVKHKTSLKNQGN